MNYIKGLLPYDIDILNNDSNLDQSIDKYEAFMFTDKDDEKLNGLIANISNRKFLIEHLLKLRDLYNDSFEIRLKKTRFNHLTRLLRRIING